MALVGYRIGSNFHGVQIFVDFVESWHPRKFYFALIFSTSRDRLATFNDILLASFEG